MSTIPIEASVPVPQADARLVDVEALRAELLREIEGEVRFDKASRALYSTDASIYLIEPVGVVVAKPGDLERIVKICGRFRCPITLRGGGTSQAGQAIGSGLIVDTSKYLNRLLELNVEEQWARVEPGIVLDELNAQLRPHDLRFAPDISTASRATIGGMMANNSAGARSVLYGKTIDHVLEQRVVLADGSVVPLRSMSEREVEELCKESTLEAQCYRTVRRIADQHADEIERRFPKVLRRVGGYNLDEFIDPKRPFNLAKLMVGSEGTLGVVLDAKLNLVPLPKAKAVLAIQFNSLLQALEATPVILRHKPSAIEVMDKFILDNTRQSAELERARQSFIQGDPEALLCVEFYGDRESDLPPRIAAVERDLRERGFGDRFHVALRLDEQARIWGLREAALGLSMAMKEDTKSYSFVEDTAVAPERLRDYIDKFLALVALHGSRAGVYAHASVGCLHVRPVVNLKTGDGIRKFEAIANDVADLVLEFGGALSGEHGDGLVRSPFMRKMFGPALYEAFREIKRTFDPHGIFNPGKIVDSPPLTENLRLGANYQTPDPRTYFDYSEYGGMGRAVEMCSGLGACRKKLDGTMCPSYMATHEEMHSTRGRANILRLAMLGRLGEAGLGDQSVYEAMDLCLECRACKAECPVGVDMARFKSEFLADYWSRHGTPTHAKALGHIRDLAELGSRYPGLMNTMGGSAPGRWLNEKLLGIDRRRTPPEWASRTLAQWAARTRKTSGEVLLFNDTFTNFYEPDIGIAAIRVLEAGGVSAGVAANQCCGRPLISKGLLSEARRQAERNTEALFPLAEGGKKIIFCEPSCLSAVKEDASALLRGEAQRKATKVAEVSVLFESFVEQLPLNFRQRPQAILLHGHCHQKAMGMLAPAKRLLARIPGAQIVDPDAGCCGMAGSFGYSKDHYEISRAIGERKLFPAIRDCGQGTAIVAAGTSCRTQIRDFTGAQAVHPAILLRSLLVETA